MKTNTQPAPRRETFTAGLDTRGECVTNGECPSSNATNADGLELRTVAQGVCRVKPGAQGIGEKTIQKKPNSKKRGGSSEGLPENQASLRSEHAQNDLTTQKSPNAVGARELTGSQPELLRERNCNAFASATNAAVDTAEQSSHCLDSTQKTQEGLTTLYQDQKEENMKHSISSHAAEIATQSKATAGPWSADKWATGFTVSAPDSHYSICHLEDCNNAEANAKLIAASPQLYEACKEADDIMSAKERSGEVLNHFERALSIRIRSALAKATPETERAL